MPLKKGSNRLIVVTLLADLHTCHKNKSKNVNGFLDVKLYCKFVMQ